MRSARERGYEPAGRVGETTADIDEAKKPKTRQARIEKTLKMLREGKKR